MKYQNPQFLYLLFAILIPVIIHLFNLRKHKKIYFSNIKLLREIKSEKKRRSNIKRILILLSRVIAIASIVLAFSNPYIPSGLSHTLKEDVIIYIDNSFSMQDVSQQGTLIDIAKEKAIEIIESSKNENKFWVLTNDLSAYESNAKNKKLSIEDIGNINTCYNSRKISEILEKVRHLKKDASTLFLISDFQESFFNLEELLELDSSLNVIIVPQEKELDNNISIDSCWLTSPINKIGNQVTMSAIIQNHENSIIDDITVNLKLNEEHKTQFNISLKEKESKKVTLNFLLDSNTINKGEISIQDHPRNFDDKIYFSFLVSDKIEVTQISETQNDHINKLFEDENIISYSTENIRSLNIKNLMESNLIILNEISNFSSGFINNIESFVRNGGSIVIIPKKNADIKEYNSLLSKMKIGLYMNNINEKVKISNLNLDHKLFQNVFKNKKINPNTDLPFTYYYYPIKDQKYSKKHDVYNLENDLTFLRNYQYYKGEIYLFASPLVTSCTNFPEHSLFVTSFINIAVQAIKSQEIYHIIGENKPIQLPKDNNESIFHLTSKYNDIIPEYISNDNKGYVKVNNQIKNAGHYSLEKDKKRFSIISFNYSRKESKTEQHKTNEIEEFINKNGLEEILILNNMENISDEIQNINKSKEFWKALILCSLLFIAIEILLIKLIKS